uniref:Uncharacterized protein n=1 Tax=Panagrolaimus sp. PS1159 TaxID=55785 RepID=A0AC35FQV0_9BILA
MKIRSLIADAPIIYSFPATSAAAAADDDDAQASLSHNCVIFGAVVVAGGVPESAAPLKCPNIRFSEHGDSLKKVPRIFMELN